MFVYQFSIYVCEDDSKINGPQGFRIIQYIKLQYTPALETEFI